MIMNWVHNTNQTVTRIKVKNSSIQMIEIFDKQPLTKQLWFAMWTETSTMEWRGHGYCTIDMTDNQRHYSWTESAHQIRWVCLGFAMMENKVTTKQHSLTKVYGFPDQTGICYERLGNMLLTSSKKASTKTLVLSKKMSAGRTSTIRDKTASRYKITLTN